MWCEKQKKEVYGVIYLVKNNINEKVYVGQTTRGFDVRYKSNIEKYPPNPHLGNAIKKYGIQNFTIIKEFKVALSREELNKLEIDCIKSFRSYDPKYGYNKTMGGEGGELTEESKKKLSEAQQKYKQSHEKNGTAYWQQEDFLNRMSEVTRGENNGMYGRKHTEESKKKMSENSKGKFCGEDSPHWGKPKSEETKKKISEARKGKGLGRGENNPMYGKTHSWEARKKISDANKGRCGENSPVAKKVKCLNTGQVFVSATQAAEYFGFKRYESVARVCRGERKSVKHPKTKQPLLFIYIS